jgi:hypothetical protein
MTGEAAMAVLPSGRSVWHADSDVQSESRGATDMNHHLQFHTERMAKDHHAALVSAAAARRSARKPEPDPAGRATGRATPGARSHRRLVASVGVALAGLLTAVGGGAADAAPSADAMCELPSAPVTELVLGRFLRAV